jgi:Arc/MetJ-type ribon-helix-helix transcriptional regulator
MLDVTLSFAAAQFIEHLVATGRYHSAAAAVDAAITYFEDHHEADLDEGAPWAAEQAPPPRPPAQPAHPAAAGNETTRRQSVGEWRGVRRHAEALRVQFKDGDERNLACFLVPHDPAPWLAHVGGVFPVLAFMALHSAGLEGPEHAHMESVLLAHFSTVSPAAALKGVIDTQWTRPWWMGAEERAEWARRLYEGITDIASSATLREAKVRHAGWRASALRDVVTLLEVHLLTESTKILDHGQAAPGSGAMPEARDAARALGLGDIVRNCEAIYDIAFVHVASCMDIAEALEARDASLPLGAVLKTRDTAGSLLLEAALDHVLSPNEMYELLDGPSRKLSEAMQPVLD